MPVGDPPPAGAGAGTSHGGGSSAGASHGGGSDAPLGDDYTTLCCTKCSKPPAAVGRCRLTLSNPS